MILNKLARSRDGPVDDHTWSHSVVVPSRRIGLPIGFVLRKARSTNLADWHGVVVDEFGIRDRRQPNLALFNL
jgi:hypothetical protein